MALMRLNQLHNEIMLKVDEKDVAIKEQIETSLQYTVGAVAPETPSIGNRWFDTVTGLMKVWNGVGEGADWELTNANAIYLPGRNAVDSASTARKQITTGSGFLEYGGRITSDKTINNAMLANKGIPRIAGIDGDETSKRFWFENFMLLNANGYAEEGIPASTDELTEILVNGITITLTGTLPNSPILTDGKLMGINLPSAPSTVTELTRDEMVFVEVWREDITETGFVFPYGNVQFTDEDADGIKTEYFNGEVSYCESFKGDNIVDIEVDENGNETTTTRPKGKGWQWSTLKAAYKNMIAANFKHNLFVDGDSLIQIRYRIRTVTFASEPATELTNSTVLGYTKDNDLTSVIKAQGKLGTVNDTDDNYKILAPYNDNNPHSLNGTFCTEYTHDLSYDGYVYALPIAIVSRRNTGVFDTIFNPNGSARFRDGLRLVADYDESDDIIGFALMDIANATLASSTTGATWDDKYEIMMKWLFDRETVLSSYDNAEGFVIGGDMNSGISGRYDGLYYNEINETDILDLRKDINKQLDLAYVLEQEFNKFILGEQRGWSKENHLYYTSGNFSQNVIIRQLDGSPLLVDGTPKKGYGFVTKLPIYYKMADGSEIFGLPTDIATQITNGYTSELYIRSGIESTDANPRPWFSKIFTKSVQISLEPILDADGNIQTDANNKIIQEIIIHNSEIYIDENTEYILVSPKNMSSRKTQLYADIIGDPKGNSYKFSTSMKVSDLPNNIILENGNIVFTGQNYYVYRGILKNKSGIESSHLDTNGNFKIDETDTNTWIEVTDRGGYSEGWKMYGNLGTALLVDEEMNSMIPRDVRCGIEEDGEIKRLNVKFFKLSKSVESIKKVIVTTDKKAGKKAFLTQITSSDDDSSILDQVDNTPATFGFDNVLSLTNNNTIAINWSAFTDDAIVEIYYDVSSNPTTISSSSRVEILGDMWVGNALGHSLGCKAISNLMNKVAIHDAPIGSKGAAKRIPLNTYLINKGEAGAILNEDWTILTHSPVDLDGSGPAIKILPYITSYRGDMYLKLLYKELDMHMDLDGKSYKLDNSQFVVVDGETVDDNGGTGNYVKIGHRKIKLPYYFGQVDKA